MGAPASAFRAGWAGQASLKVAFFFICCALAPPVHGQTVYRWTDNNGVVHFSDSSPPKGTSYVEQQMPPVRAPAKPKGEPKPADKSEEDSAKAGGGSDSTPEPSGPARVIISKKHLQQEGPSAREISGKVENVGGAEARDVYVAIKITNLDQGDECLQDEIVVTPSTLAPGATAAFAASIDNPCFFGNAGVDLVPQWR